jgi:hypothetical protein
MPASADLVPASSSHWSTRWPPELLLLLTAVMVAVIAAPLNPDSAYCLVAGRRLLEGDQLYVDMMETNPPMIFWMMAVLAFVGRYLAISDARLIGSFVAVLLFVSAVSGLKVLALAPRASRLTRFVVMGGFLISVALPFIAWVGQREQIAAVLLFPYALLATRAVRGLESSGKFSIWCGILAGVGLAIKPYFLAAWVAIELVVLITTRRVPRSNRPDFWCVVLVQCGFAATVFTMTPEYVTRIVPLAQALYWEYQSGGALMLYAERLWMLVLIGCAALAVPWWLKTKDNLPDVQIFGAATLGWLVAYVAQGKGWYYHLLPAIVFGTVALVLTVVHLAVALRTLGHQHARRRISIVALVIPVVAAGIWVLPIIPRLARHAMAEYQQRDSVLKLAEYVERTAPGEPVYFLSTSVWPAFPVVNLSGARWPYRYHFLWPIPALYAREANGEPRYRLPGDQGSLERDFFDTVVGDLKRVPPRVLVIDRMKDQQAMRGRQFDFVTYFSGSPEFGALFRQYRRRGYIGSWELYELR